MKREVKRENRGLTRLDGARDKKQVWRPHVRTLVFRKQMHCIEERAYDIVGTFRRPPKPFGARGIVPGCPPVVTPLFESSSRVMMVIQCFRHGAKHTACDTAIYTVKSR